MVGDDLGRVPGDQIGVEVDPSLLGLCFGVLKDAREVRVLPTLTTDEETWGDLA